MAAHDTEYKVIQRSCCIIQANIPGCTSPVKFSHSKLLAHGNFSIHEEPVSRGHTCLSRECYVQYYILYLRITTSIHTHITWTHNLKSTFIMALHLISRALL